MNTGFLQKFMTLISTILLPRRLLIYICSALWFVITASPAYALPNNEVETEYFSDSSFTEGVGSKVLTCLGKTFSVGETSNFTAKFSTPCNQATRTSVLCTVNGVRTTCPPNICDVNLYTCL